ncbi:hypothetical protein TNCV_1042211, partial [Trichonephila clavipes]
MPPGSNPKSYGAAVSVVNHYTGWVTYFYTECDHYK